MRFKKTIPLLFGTLVSSVAITCISSCNFHEPYVGCEKLIRIHTTVESEIVNASDITSDSPMKLISVALAEGSRFQSTSYTFYIGEDGTLKSKNSYTFRNDKPLKYIACWPISANIDVDEQGNIVNISNDCKVIGESGIIYPSMREATIILRDIVK